MRNFFIAAGVLAASVASFSLNEAKAQRAACDFTYTIQAGDTLPDIAETAYGRRTYSLIFARNFGKITNPARLPEGETIILPCLPNDPNQQPNEAALEARMAAATPSAPAQAAQEIALTPSVEAPATADNQRVRILTSSGNAPYADEALRNGGMATELTVRALRKATGADGFEIVFINDRTKHLRELVWKGSFDIAFPWDRPPCERIESVRDVNPEDAWLCDNFEFSEPFFEVVSGFFVMDDGSPNRRGFEDFAASAICRPSDEPLTDLIANGITEEFADFFTPKKPEDCLQLLQNGFVEAVVGDVFDMEAAIFDLGLQDAVEELPELSLLTSVHAVAPKAKPTSVAALDTLNQGMLEMKLSGEWFRVLSAHLNAQN